MLKKFLLIALLFIFCAGVNAAFAESARDYLLEPGDLPNGWKVVSVKKWDETYVMERESGIIDKYHENIETDKKEYVGVTALLFSAPEGAARCLDFWNHDWYIHSTSNPKPIDPNMGDGGFYYPGHDDYGDTHNYCFRKGRATFSVWSRNKDLAWETVSLLLGERRQKAPVQLPFKKENIKSVFDKFKGAKNQGRTSPAVAIAIALGLGALGLGGIGGLGALAYFLLKPFLAKPVISVARPPAKLPKIDIKKPEEIARQEEKKEKKEKRERIISRIEINAVPGEIVADGRSRSKLTFRVFDSENKPVAGETIRFQLSRDAHKLPQSAVTGAGGEIHLDYVASVEERTIAIIAHSVTNPAITQAVQIKERKPKIAEIVLKISPDEVVADGKSKAEVQITALNEVKQPADGEKIELWFENYDGSKIEPGLVTTDSNGGARATFTSGKDSGHQKLSSRAQSNWKVKADAKIKLKEEIYYEVRDNLSGLRVRVNIPDKGLDSIKPCEVLGARVLDNFDNEVKRGFSVKLFELAALVGHYGIKNDFFYKKKENIWRNVHLGCSRTVAELGSALSVGLGVGIMSFTSSVVTTIAEEFGGKLISLSAKILGQAGKRMEKSKIGLEMQEKVYSLIQKEKEYYERMASIAEELASCWGIISHSGGSPDSASEIMYFDKEIEFYKLNNKVLAVAQQKGKLTESFSESDYAAIRSDMENINKTILEASSERNSIKGIASRISSLAV